jgi:uncharacterized delta-60 repeat protein
MTGTGIVITQFPIRSIYMPGGFGATLQSDGKILVSGTAGGTELALARYNANGTLDTSFDGDGIVSHANTSPGVSVAVQGDGKILTVAGEYYGLELLRYTTNGQLDTGFDGDGIVATIWRCTGLDVKVQADGKILAAGLSGPDFVLVRYNSNGTLDKSFSGDGVVASYDLPYGSQSIALQADDKIVTAGGSGDVILARFNTDGTFDTSFDDDGKVRTHFSTKNKYLSESPDCVIVQPDGRILVAGTINYQFGLVRYNSNGSVDTTFGNGGMVSTDVGAIYQLIKCVALQADGKILAAGTRSNDFAIVRYNPDGTLDTSFDADGIVCTDLGGYADCVYNVWQQADGKIVAAGNGGNGFGLARYNANGSLDTSFGVDNAAPTTQAGTERADTFSNAVGNDVINGGAGTDTLICGSNRSNFTLTKTSSGFTAHDITGALGFDTLANVERIQFNDVNVALDLGVAQSGGEAVLLVGAVLPGLLGLDSSKQQLIGAVMALMDAGYSMRDLSGAALRLPIWDVLTGQSMPTNAAIATYLLTNVLGHSPDSTALAAAINALDTESFQGDWLANLAVSAEGQAHVNLVGLAESGLLYS